ncbi:PRC and DUF2382 domain-containing protein [Actinomadura macrotermitis]|uniref:DUF2382 domain-containing protein n=1 Tax=Actinomadura macrotermitis TaxID=2585200 RepID=A0A7K0BXR8_9ACTN|nr:hypothetical protein [Actinomadura macrotermitis]
MQTKTTGKELMDREVTGSDGAKLGHVKQVYLNDATGAPEWVTVNTGWFGQRESFIPLADARHHGDTLQVPYDKEKIKGAPSIDADQHLGRQEVAELYRYYGLQPARGTVPNQPGKANGQPVPPGPAGHPGHRPGEQHYASQRPVAQQPPDQRVGGHRAPEPDRAAMIGGRPGPANSHKPGREETAHTEGVELIRSEEQLRIDKEQLESGQARLRKWVEIEHVQMSVPVIRERLKVEREPVTGDYSGEPSIGEDEQVIILHEERVIVSKETVAVERVRVSVEQYTEQEDVEDEVRKERVEVVPEDEVDMLGDRRMAPDPMLHDRQRDRYRR